MVEVSKLKGAYIDRADARATVAQLGEQWMERHRSKITASSYHSVESAWRIHVLPEWGGTRLAQSPSGRWRRG